MGGQSLRTPHPVNGGSAPSAGFDPLVHRLLETLPAGAYTCDADGLITWYNPQAVKVWGRAPALRDPVDRFCGSFRLFSPEGCPIEHSECWMALALRNRRDYHGEEIVVEREDGTRITALAHASPVHDERGELLGAVNVLVDISDRKRAEEVLLEATRAKSEFLATMSHEIRTPINAIVGYLDLLELEVDGSLSPAQRAHLARIKAASRHLNSLVAEVLDLSTVESGKMVVELRPCAAGTVAEEAVIVLQPLAAASGITLSYECRSDPVPLYLGDEDRVRQMLINLLSNAIKFSERGQRVELVCSIGPRDDTPFGRIASPVSWVRFDVHDTGMGITRENLERIFEPFVQLEAAHTRTRGGTGLGLPIARHLARLMGGELTVRSTPGEGSTFTLWLQAAEEGREAAGTPAEAPEPYPPLH